jgi:6-phosphogluconate dehydrogenase (decarboxylating)
MALGMIGLGRMGTDRVRLLQCAGHPCVVCDVDAKSAFRHQFDGREEKAAAIRAAA